MKTKLTKLGESYWSHNGANQELYNELYDELVPASGEADTILGEAIRVASKLAYEYANNGNCNAVDATEVSDNPYYDYCEDAEPEYEYSVNEIYDGYLNYLKEIFTKYLADRAYQDNALNLIWQIRDIIEKSGYCGGCSDDEDLNAYDLLIDYVLMVGEIHPELKEKSETPYDKLEDTEALEAIVDCDDLDWLNLQLKSTPKNVYDEQYQDAVRYRINEITNNRK